MKTLVKHEINYAQRHQPTKVVIKLSCDQPLQNTKLERIQSVTMPSATFTTSPKILLVEDNPTLQMLNKELLISLGCEVDIAKNGFEALALFKQGYDLIFMDIGLPDIFGTYVAAEIRQYEQDCGMTNKVPIIALTAMCEEVTEECLAAGMNEVATKPTLIEGLKKILINYLGADALKNDS